MDWSRLSQVTAPAGRPVTTAELKAHLRIDTADEDSYLDALIDRAVGVIDGPRGIGICIESQVWKWTLDGFPSGATCLRVPLGPVISIDAIAYLDAAGAQQTWNAADYRVMNAGELVTIEPAYGGTWPTTRIVSGAVEITFSAGHAAAPAALKNLVILLAAMWWEDRTPPAEARDLPWPVKHLMGQYRAGVVA